MRGSAHGSRRTAHFSGSRPRLDGSRNGLLKCATIRASLKGSGVRLAGRFAAMGRQMAIVLYVAAMIAVIVGVDLLFLRTRFWGRLAVNIGIVLVFAAFYFSFLKQP
jgi:hypothetical protein